MFKDFGVARSSSTSAKDRPVLSSPGSLILTSCQLVDGEGEEPDYPGYGQKNGEGSELAEEHQSSHCQRSGVGEGKGKRFSIRHRRPSPE